MLGRRRKTEPSRLITFDEVGVRHPLPDGGVREVRWDDLQEVACIATSKAASDTPFAIVLRPSAGDDITAPPEFVYPELLDRLRELPMFFADILDEGMNTRPSIDSVRFVAWERTEVQRHMPDELAEADRMAAGT